MNNGRDPSGNGQACDPTVVACVVFQTQDPERLVELLRQALAGIPDQARAERKGTISPSLERQVEDPWPKHGEAAEYHSPAPDEIEHQQMLPREPQRSFFHGSVIPRPRDAGK